ncbi:DNA polymerase IV [Opitutaceae bacterium TAV5]|nr:DNA polymerase IV [Opitutaceae bacterium TAV5]
MRPLPTIVHLDADAFFVSVELALQPEYRGKKVAVGGRERGIIASASYEARACGVYTPMPTARALKICPDLILLPHKGSYGGVSRRMFDLCEQLTPIVQRNSIDEGYLDVTMCGFKTVPQIEEAIRALQQRIWHELQIPVSMGIATNRLVSQIASKLRKPRGFVVVPPGEETAFLAPLPVGKLPGVGDKTEEALHARGLRLVSDITDLARRCLARGESGERELQTILGHGWPDLLAAARGEDDRPVETEHDDAKSYSKQETFPSDVGDFATIERVAKGMIDELMPAIRADGKRVRTLTVKVRYGDFTQRSVARTLPTPDDLETTFYPLVAPLLRQAWMQRRPLRLVSVKLSGVEDGAVQLEMFARTDEKRRKLATVLDQLNAAKGVPRVQHGHQLDGKNR